MLGLALLFGCGSAQAESTVEAQFMMMSKASRQEYQKVFKQATVDFQKKKILSAIRDLEKADKIFSKDANVKCFLGLCYAELHDFEKAKEMYRQALKLNPDHYGTKVNLAEMAYFRGEWESAYAQYAKLLTKHPVEVAKSKALTEYKMLLCASHLAEQSKHKVKYTEVYQGLLSKYSYLDDTPYYYYAMALQEYRKDASEDALDWITKAYRVFSDVKLLNAWDKALIDCGYLKEHELMINVTYD